MADNTLDPASSVPSATVLSRPLDALIELFRDHKDDESGGIQAVRGFGFQIWQAVVEALVAHQTTLDYAVVSEWKEDIAVLNDTRQPTRVKFIQSKKSEAKGSKDWTLASLHTLPPAALPKPPVKTSSKPAAKKTAAKRKASSQSILSKLYGHRTRLAPMLGKVELVFSTNSAFLLPISGGGERYVDEIELSDLAVPERTKLKKELAIQLGVDEAAVSLDGVFLRRSQVPVDEPHHAVAGMLARLSEHGLIRPTVTSPFVTVCIMASYVTLKTGKRSYAKDLPTLLQRAITRSDVANYIASTNKASVSSLDLIELAAARLDQENEDPDISRDMRAAAQSVFARLTDPRSTLWTLVKALLDLYRFNSEYKHVGKLLGQRFEKWFSDFCALPSVVTIASPPLPEAYCLMALIYHDAREIKLLSAPTTDSKSPQGQ